MNPLWKGALKSGVSSATALILALPAVDKDHFSLTSWQGVAHLAELILWVVLVSEARFWKDWADKP